MLNKKSAFKPKAAVRRPPPGSAPKGPQRPSPADRPSNTPAPREAPSTEPSAAPTPTPAPDTPLAANPPASGVSTPKDAGTPLEAQGKEREPSALASKASTPAVSVPAGGDEQPPQPVPVEAPRTRPSAPVRSQRPRVQKAPVVQEPATLEKPVGQDAQSGTGEQAEAVKEAAANPASPEGSAASTSSSASPAEGTPSIQISSAAPEPTTAPATPRASQPIEEPQPATAPATETAKPKRGRKRATATAPSEDSVEQGTAAPPKKRPRKRAAALPGEEGYKPASTRVTRSRKRPASAAENDEAEEDGEDNTEGPKRRPPRPQREATPPDAETVEIDITQVKMADLAKDMHIGKKFSLHDELMERERAKRLRYIERRKRQQSGEEGDEAVAGVEEASPTRASTSNPDSPGQATPAASEDTPAAETPAPEGPGRAPIGETYQIIDGEIVLDHRSLQVDRHARAREEAGELVEVEENDFTNHTTSATYLRRNLKPQQWTDEETDLFYRALAAFGTDFDTICRMFRGKTRKHIKLKFNREERVAPARVTAALVGQKTVSIDMDDYQRATGRAYETAEAIYAEQRKAEEEFEARQQALEDEKAEEVRRKKEEVLAQLTSAVDGQNGGDSGGGKKGAGKRGRKKKGPPVMGL